MIGAGRRRKCVPADLSLSTTVFVALAPRLGELPRDLLPRVVEAYRAFDSLNALVRRFADRVDAPRGEASPRRRADAPQQLDRQWIELRIGR